MIQCQNLAFSYPQSTIKIDLPELNVDQGQKVAVVGPSGSGKSTLLNMIAGFLLPAQGNIMLNGENHTLTKPHQRPVSMLFQQNNLFNHLNVTQNLVLGIHPKLSMTENQCQKIEMIADKVGLSAHLSRYPDKLSGGQQQRVALARCMLRNQPILLLDEPFSALDKSLRIEMLDLLNTICAEKELTVMLVTHQPEELSAFVDKIITIGD